MAAKSLHPTRRPNNQLTKKLTKKSKYFLKCLYISKFAKQTANAVQHNSPEQQNARYVSGYIDGVFRVHIPRLPSRKVAN